MLVGLMFASLLMSVAMADAFDGRVVGTHVGVSTLHWLPGRGRRIDLEHTEIAGGHLVERFRLFFIIALGETVLTTGTAFAGEPFAPGRLLALAIGFTGTVALWWCYFQRAERIGVEVAEAAEDGGAVGLWGTWTLTLIVLALIVGIAASTAVLVAVAIADPVREGDQAPSRSG